jgi:hypothetical protein
MDISTVNNAVNQAFTSSNPGGVGTSYGQADSGLINQAVTDHPELANALSSGNVSLGFNADTGQNILINNKTGQEIQGNYTVSSTPAGGVAINLPLSNGAMVQVDTGVGQNGQVAPVSASNVYNVGLNAGAGGFAGGINDLKPLLTQAALMYAGSQLSDYLNTPSGGTSLNQIGDVPTDFSANTSPVYSPDVTGTPLAGIDANVPTTPLTDAGTPISQVSNVTNNPAWNGTELTPAQVAANTNPIDLNSLPNGGVQNFGAGAITNANLAGMDTAYTNAMANGGFTSGYQTLPDGSRVMIQNDGTAIQTNPATGQTTALNTNQVQTLIKNGTLNSASSGYNAATGGTAIAPGGGTINANGTTTLPSGATIATPLNSVASPVTTNTGNVAPPPPGSTTNALGLTPLQTGLLGATALNALGSSKTSNAISNAAATQAEAAKNSQDVLGGFYSQYAKAQQPYQNLGSGAAQAITEGAPYFTHQFGPQDLAAGLAPNYDFMLQQGQRANQNAANVSGGLLSGNTLQGMQNYTQNFAGNAYQNAFNNYQQQRQNIYGNLSNAAGLGQTSLGQLGQVGASLGNTYGNITTGLAASQAGAQTAQAVNQANLLSSLGNAALVSSIAGTPGTNLNLKLA